MKTQIKISKDIPALPDKAVTEKMAWLGTTGGGKTYAASAFAEQCWHIGAQFVVLDPVGVWYGLRLAKDGKKPSKINIPIFGGLHGDVPLESTGGELLANLVVDKNLSCIIDVSQFESDAEKARFATDFANKLFFRKKSSPSAMHLFLEECQEFVPQNPMKGEEKMLHSFIRMQKLGRNFGIGSSYITQRPQEVNKKALNMCQTLFVFRTTGTHERKAIEIWMKDKDLDQDIASDLPKLATGTCHVWSPEFLKVSKIIKISEKETFNASATPEVGAKAKARHLAPIDLEKVRAEMAATIEKAKAVDPKELKKRILYLETELKKKQSTAPAKEIYVHDKRETEKAIAQNNKEWKKIVQSWIDFANFIFKNFREASNDTTRRFDIIDSHRPIVEEPKDVELFYPSKRVEIKTKPINVQSMSIKVERTPMYGEEEKPLSKGAKSILAYLESVAPEERSKTQMWVATGYSPGGGFNNMIYELTGKNLISVAGRGYVANGVETPTGDFEASLDLWKNKLGTGPRKIFDQMLGDTGRVWTKEQLAYDTGYALGGGFNNNIYVLTGAELIKKEGTGYIINPEILEL